MSLHPFSPLLSNFHYIGLIRVTPPCIWIHKSTLVTAVITFYHLLTAPKHEHKKLLWQIHPLYDICQLRHVPTYMYHFYNEQTSANTINLSNRGTKLPGCAIDLKMASDKKQCLCANNLTTLMDFHHCAVAVQQTNHFVLI